MIRVGQDSIDMLDIERLDVFGADRVPRGAAYQTLDTEKVGRPLMHELPPLAQQITHRSLLLRINVALWQYAQPKHLGKPVGIMPVVRVSPVNVLEQLDAGC